MADKHFKLEIITPEKVVYSADVEHVMAPGKNGYFGVKVNHIPFLTLLKIGELTANSEKKEKLFAISGGIVEIADNKMTILAETAEAATDIDVDRAKRARERAEQRIKEKLAETNLTRARASLMRAINRIDVAAGSH